MLYNIYEKIKRIPDANQIIAINIDEGISKNEEKQIKYIEEFLDNFGIDVKLIKLSFKNDFGHSLDELVSIFKQKRINLNPCSICATIRRRLLNDTAKKMNATKLAIGHNLDDIAQTLLLNILRNDVRKIGINPPHASIQYENPANNQNEYHLVPRIKPLIFLKDEEIMHYVTFKGFPVYNKPCFYSLNTPILRKKVQLFLNDLELRNAEIKFNLIKANYNLFNIINQSLNENEDKNEDKNANKNEDKNTNKNKAKKEKSNELNYNRCKVCGQPAGSNRDLCLFCWFKKVLGEL
ncbi:MAG: ATP-binding protein, partial [Promethearchaeota archaeon]